jgi:uncharacterized Zn-binding protein involved in type VI secretion
VRVFTPIEHYGWRKELIMPPAARVGDNHFCPMFTGTVPHIGGPILPPCCPTVIIEGKAAARAGDLAHCNGPLDDMIREGSPTVIIGGQQAARLGDPTDKGLVVQGCSSVFIGISGQGQALVDAAEDGIPFCESCA